MRLSSMLHILAHVNLPRDGRGDQGGAVLTEQFDGLLHLFDQRIDTSGLDANMPTDRVLFFESRRDDD